MSMAPLPQSPFKRRKAHAPTFVPGLSHRPYFAKKDNVTGLPRENIEDACDDARKMNGRGTGAMVVDSKGTVLVRWVSAASKAFWRTIPE